MTKAVTGRKSLNVALHNLKKNKLLYHYHIGLPKLIFEQIVLGQHCLHSHLFGVITWLCPDLSRSSDCKLNAILGHGMFYVPLGKPEKYNKNT